MALLGTIQSLQSNNEQLVEWIKIIENQKLPEQVDTVIGKIDSISKGTSKLPERVHTVEFDIQKLPQNFDKVTYRMVLQDGNLYGIQEKFKDMLSLKGNITLKLWNHKCRMWTKKLIP